MLFKFENISNNSTKNISRAFECLKFNFSHWIFSFRSDNFRSINSFTQTNTEKV